MKIFIFKVFAFSLPLLCGLVITNYIGDPAEIFTSKYEQKMAQIISKGQHVNGLSNFDERLFQKEVIPLLNYSPKTIVIGSSRTMLISKEIINEKSFFNHSVSGATHEDLIAIYQIYKTHRDLPKKIILGVDPWMFNQYSNFVRWKSIASYYDQFVDTNPFNLGIDFFKVKELVSLSYFQGSVEQIHQEYFDEDVVIRVPTPGDNKIHDKGTKVNDGSVVYPKNYREASKEVVQNKVNSYITKSLYGINSTKEIAPRLWKEFDLLVQDMKNNNIEVQFFLAPYHPKVYKDIEEKHTMVLNVEKQIKEYASKHNIHVYGSYDPTQNSFDDSFFFDGMHSRPKTLVSIFGKK